MRKELLMVEFSYDDVDERRNERVYIIKKFFAGIYDSLDEAITKGNEIIKMISKYFEVRPDDFLTKNYAYGLDRRLATNCCYKKPEGITYSVAIEPVESGDIEKELCDILKTRPKYFAWKEKEDENED